jgi:peptide-methionine (S)-S-oxide reductase
MQTHSILFRHAQLRKTHALSRIVLTLLGTFAFLRLVTMAAAEPAIAVPSEPATPASKTERVVLAGGCFWGVQAVFQHTKGVANAVSGYAGGTLPGPSYEQVSSGRTGHAESVEVTFDPKQISFDRLLQIYFTVAHDPTELNRQGPDEGTQYRSEIFATSDAQRQAAKATIATLDKAHAFSGKIATKVEPLQVFYPAELYHQNYATLHPSNPYIAVYDLPKIASLKRLYPEFYRERAALAAGDHEQQE